MPPPKPTGSTGKQGSPDRADREKSNPGQDQQILAFRDPEELRLARVGQFRSLSDAIYSSLGRSMVRKKAAIEFFPQKPHLEAAEALDRAESALAHKLGPSRDQKFDVDLVVKLLKILQPDEQIDVLVYLMRELKLEVSDGRVLPRHRPSKAAAVDALRKDTTAMFSALMSRLDSIADDAGEDE